MSPGQNAQQFIAHIRAHEPFLKIESELGETWLITRFDDVQWVLRDADTFSSIANAKGIGLVMGSTIIEMDGKQHQRQRRLITPSFSPRAIRETAPTVIDSSIDHLIDKFAADGEADLVKQFTYTFPIRVIAALIGVPIDDYHQFHTWALQLVSVYDDPKAGFAAAKHIVDHLKPIVEERRLSPKNDLLSTLAHARIDDEALLEEEILSFLRLLLPAGAETTYRFTGTILHALLTHPEAIAAARARPENLGPILEEVLRWESPVQYVSRETTKEVQVAGVALPAGVLIMAAIGSANRDETKFPEGHIFDRHRANANEHLAFGFGAHFCLGTHLARMEAHRAVTRLLERLPGLRLDDREESHIVGVAFRSPDKLQVRFDS
ncbi:MAG: cytochrome P450 [Proteobacteria bacterium]|nr:cytochrome P450 [Pseudomonadota bacterium]